MILFHSIPRILVFSFVWLFGVFALVEARCSYKPPGRNEVLPAVSLEPTHRIEKRSATDDDWETLRFSIYYDEKSLNALPRSQQTLIKDVIFPGATKFWSEALRVLRSKEVIRLHRKCTSNAAGEYKVHYPDPSNTNIFYCDKGCDVDTFCGDVRVPDSHLLQCLFLATVKPSSSSIFSSLFPVTSEKQSSGPADGAGVDNADFILYVSTMETERCNVSKTVAYAAHCQQEMTNDRPIAGHANLCPHAISEDPSDVEAIMSTVKHEILHALGFSVALFAFFRDAKTGQPLTKRDKYKKPPWSSSTNTYQWDATTVREIERPDWQVRGGPRPRRMNMVVTPRVVEESRKHFGCKELEGAELENQGGEGTLLTHWEKRVFENEAMTGVHTQNPVYSRITLALLEDSGWYRPDYSVAQDLRYGKNLGCNFAMKSCKSWMDLALAEKKASAEPFCRTVKNLSSGKMIKTECSASRSALSICNLSPYSEDLPPEYQNFDQLPGVSPSAIGKYGGSVDLADFCPFMQEFSWKTGTGQVRGSRCSQITNQPEDGVNFAMEDYGNSSVCIEQDKPWTERSCSYTRTWQHWGSGCYKHSCTDGRLVIDFGNRSAICYYEGQILQVQVMGRDWLHAGNIICPSCADICQSVADFTCLPEKLVGRQYQDKSSWDYLDCRAAHSMPFSAVLALISLVISLLLK